MACDKCSIGTSYGTTSARDSTTVQKEDRLYGAVGGHWLCCRCRLSRVFAASAETVGTRLAGNARWIDSHVKSHQKLGSLRPLPADIAKSSKTPSAGLGEDAGTAVSDILPCHTSVNVVGVFNQAALKMQRRNTPNTAGSGN